MCGCQKAISSTNGQTSAQLAAAATLSTAAEREKVVNNMQAAIGNANSR